MIQKSGHKLLVAVCLAAILALGAFLRLYKLDFQSMWNDELSTVFAVDQPSLQALSEYIDRTNHPPTIYYLLAYATMKTFGSGEVALRMPSVMAGILGIFVLFFLGRQVYDGEAGLLAAGLLAVSWSGILYSQEVRVHGFLVFLSALSGLTWLAMLKYLPSGSGFSLWFSSLAYIAVSILFSYTHPFGLILTCLQCIYSFIAFLQRRQVWKRLLIVYAAFGILYLPWLPLQLRDISGLWLWWMNWVQRPGLAALIELGEYLYGKSTFLILVSVALSGFAVWIDLFRRAKQKDLPLEQRLLNPTMVLLLWLIVPPLVIFLQSRIIEAGRLFLVRYMMFVVPPALLLTARGATLLPLRAAWRYVVYAGLVVMALGNLIFIQDYYTAPAKEQFREAAMMAADAREQYPNTAVVAFVWNPYFIDHYFKQADSPLRVEFLAGQPADLPGLETFLEEKQAPCFWYLTAHRAADPAFLQTLDERYRLLHRQDLIGASARLYALQPGAANGQECR